SCFCDTATTGIYTLSLHDALPIYVRIVSDDGQESGLHHGLHFRRRRFLRHQAGVGQQLGCRAYGQDNSKDEHDGDDTFPHNNPPPVLTSLIITLRNKSLQVSVLCWALLSVSKGGRK